MSLVGRVLRQQNSLLKAMSRCATAQRSGSYVPKTDPVKVGGFRTPENHSKHRRILSLYDLMPEISDNVYIAPNALLSGEVYLDDNVSVWDGAVLRGDLNAIRVGFNAVIRENTTLTTVSSLPTGIPSFTNIGPYTYIEPDCTLISCSVGSQCLIGAKTVILEGAKIEDESVIGPNSVVPPGRYIPSHEMWAGNPVKYVRDLTKKEIWTIRKLATEA